jgi:hypothetical protein
VAGDGSAAFSGERARPPRPGSTPRRVAVDAFGNLVLADTGNGRIQEIAG